MGILNSELSEKLFVKLLPLPISKLVFSLARKTLLKNKDSIYFEKAFNRINSANLEGDYLEFGVYRGSSFTTSFMLAKKKKLSRMRFFAFDSFSGLPEGEGGIWEAGMYCCSRKRFTSFIHKTGVDLKKVIIIEGLYSDTLNEETKSLYQLRKAAIIHVDCDLYSSTVTVLSFIESLLSTGTIIIFDDWNCFSGDDNHGEKKAFNEWHLKKSFREFYSTKQSKAFICLED